MGVLSDHELLAAVADGDRGRRTVGWAGRAGGLDLGHRHPPPHRRAPQPGGWDRSLASVIANESEIVVEHGDLAGALRRLSPELRAVVEATVLEGLTTREAARLLDIPSGTVKTRMVRARTQLRGALA